MARWNRLFPEFFYTWETRSKTLLALGCVFFKLEFTQTRFLFLFTKFNCYCYCSSRSQNLSNLNCRNVIYVDMCWPHSRPRLKWILEFSKAWRINHVLIVGFSLRKFESGGRFIADFQYQARYEMCYKFFTVLIKC